jgi:hypothetical protein
MFGKYVTRHDGLHGNMGLFGQRSSDGPAFDGYDEFVPSNIPDPGPALTDHTVLEGTDHVAVHKTARDVFEERGVYDSTFGYNLAKLNLDHRHPDAGYRYAVPGDGTLIAEFTPTTPFCPQSAVLTKASHRAWNGLRETHDFDEVAIRIAPMHQNSAGINEQLANLPIDEESEAP